LRQFFSKQKIRECRTEFLLSVAKTQVIPANTGLSTYAVPSDARYLKNFTHPPHPAAFKIFSIITLYIFLTELSTALYSFTPVFL
jgi:hypothetical protein